MSEPVGNSPRGNIPGNSHKEREAKEAEAAPREELEKIVEGKVVTRKPSFWKRFSRSLVAEDAHSIGDYVWMDVLLPALRNAIRDVVVGSTDRALYGTTRSSSFSGRRGSSQPLRTRYDRIAEEPSRRSISREARARHDFDDVVLDSYAEAVEVVETMISRVDRYGSASIADLYDLLGVTGSFADQRWGWRDLRGADVRQTRGGYLLDLPEPEPLNR